MLIKCICKTEFDAEPQATNGWIINCPNCNATLRAHPPGVSGKEYRVGIKNSNPAKAEPQRIAERVRNLELFSSFAWIIIGAVQIFFVWTAAAGAWNIINAILRLRCTKNIQPQNPNVVKYFDERKNWLIAFAAVNLILGGVVGVFLVAVDWINRDFALKNRAIFDPEAENTATELTTQPPTNHTPPPADKNNCEGCGAKINGTVRFCSNCGKQQ